MKTVYEVVQRYLNSERKYGAIARELNEIKEKLNSKKIDKPTAIQMQRRVLDKFIDMN